MVGTAEVAATIVTAAPPEEFTSPSNHHAKGTKDNISDKGNPPHILINRFFGGLRAER